MSPACVYCIYDRQHICTDAGTPACFESTACLSNFSLAGGCDIQQGNTGLFGADPTTFMSEGRCLRVPCKPMFKNSGKEDLDNFVFQNV